MNWLQKVMYGRHGSDQLSFFLLALYIILSFLSGLPVLSVLRGLALLPLALAAFRILSRNHEKRRAENDRFLAFMNPLLQWLKYRRAVYRDKDHRYFKCPNCGQHLRAPRGKGKIHVTCRSCGVSFEEYT